MSMATIIYNICVDIRSYNAQAFGYYGLMFISSLLLLFSSCWWALAASVLVHILVGYFSDLALCWNIYLITGPSWWTPGFTVITRLIYSFLKLFICGAMVPKYIILLILE